MQRKKKTVRRSSARAPTVQNKWLVRIVISDLDHKCERVHIGDPDELINEVLDRGIGIVLDKERFIHVMPTSVSRILFRKVGEDVKAGF